MKHLTGLSKIKVGHDTFKAMAVYREGYFAIQEYQKRECQIWNDSCDVGVPVNLDDSFWKLIHQTVEFYKIEGTRKRLRTGEVQVDIKLIDEWAVSDARKTIEPATEIYRVSYFRFGSHPRDFAYRDYEGFISICKQ